MIKRITAHIHYWNKWRKKFTTSYSKIYKFLVLIGLKKPYTLRLLIFADKYNAAVLAVNRLSEIFNQKAPEGEAWRDKEGESNEVPEV